MRSTTSSRPGSARNTSENGRPGAGSVGRRVGRREHVALAVGAELEHRIVGRRRHSPPGSAPRSGRRSGRRAIRARRFCQMPGWSAPPIIAGGHGVCSRTSASSLFSRITIMSTRRSSSRSMMRSLTPCRPPSGLRGSATSSQFLKAARWSSPQNFERALRLAQSASVSLEAQRLPVRRAARQVLRDVEAERHRQLLVLDGGDVEICGRRDRALPPARRDSRSAPSCPSRTPCRAGTRSARSRRRTP